MRAAMLLLLGGMMLGAAGARAGRAGEGLATSGPTVSVSAPRPLLPPDTSRKALRPDSVVADMPAVVLAEDEKPTRKTSIRIVFAIALLTVTTLLLYNVRSR
ncbi:hypothetical protein LGH70_21185 [Hymenobacter sp. BT635]|uniref:Uncharacterized protein n=1 Tax=Hymenobacter nitidus TaxID=2880929 RepID=A0ABS8AI53_9BACT|nr:hypothetical protein [Hymenobacter nitidus]MCB2380123.1 hypothetical protein [Hymenobacter nitidus]